MKKKLHIIQFIQVVAILLFCVDNTNGQPYFFRHYQVENGLSNNTVYCSIQDESGFLWFGTKDGLNRFDGYHFKLYNINDDGRTLAPDLIGFLFVDKKNVLWVGSQKGLYTFNRQKESLVRFLDSFTDISSIQTDKKGQLWFISRFTVCRYNFDTKELRIFSPEKYFDATSLCLSEEGDIWVSSPNGYIHKFDDAGDTFQNFNLFSHSPPASSNWIHKIYPAGKNSLFIGTTSQGLKQFDISKSDYTDLLTYNTDRTTVYIRDIKKYADNEFWFATRSEEHTSELQSQ